MTTRPFAAASHRNSAPILGVLAHEFRHCSTVLEIGSGTGQHAVAFAASLVHLQWQTSDLDENHAAIRQWIDAAALPNVLAPLSLDVRNAEALDGSVDAVFSANTAHIMDAAAVEQMIVLVGNVLRVDGRFCLYGPFSRGGRFNSASNAEFDRTLRVQGRGSGIRDLDELERQAARCGMLRQRLYAMPANNNLAVWTKASST